MKAVIQNTILSLLCLAGVVLAAPTQSISHYKHGQNLQIPAPSMVNLAQDQPVTSSPVSEAMPSIQDGSIRFACY